MVKVAVRLLTCLSIGWLILVCVYLMLILPLVFKLVSGILTLFVISILAGLLTLTE
nr:MAG TPA: hypothetical protein [Caudoviricetes sp.]